MRPRTRLETMRLGRDPIEKAIIKALWRPLVDLSKLDPFTVTPDLVTIDRDLHVKGRITAEKNIVAHFASAYASEIFANLLTESPLYKPTASKIGLRTSALQFEVNAAGELQIKAGVLTPSEHTQAMSTITGLTDALAAKAGLNSPALTGAPTVPTPETLDNSTRIANTAFVRAVVAGLVDSSPASLDTLNELATAMGNDPNFATTVLNSLAGKVNVVAGKSLVNDTDIAKLVAFSITPELVTIDRNLHVSGKITAEKNIIAHFASAYAPELFANLVTESPLYKPTASKIGLKYNTAQMEVNGLNELQIKAGVLAPMVHSHAIADVTGLVAALNGKLDSVNHIHRTDTQNDNTYSGISHTHGLTRYSLAAPALIDGLTASNFRTTLFGNSSQGYNISAARWNNTPSVLSVLGMGPYSTMIAWSGGDTHGFLSTDYNGANIVVGGGYGDNISWGAKLWHSGNLTNALTNNYLPVWRNGSFVNSLLSDNGTNVSIGTSGPNKFNVFASTMASYFEGGSGGYSAIQFGTAGEAVKGSLTAWEGNVLIGRRNSAATGSEMDIIIKGSNGNVTVGYYVNSSESNSYKFAVNGNAYFNGGLHSQGVISTSGGINSTTTNSNFFAADVNIGYSSYQGYMLAVNGATLFNGNSIINGEVKARTIRALSINNSETKTSGTNAGTALSILSQNGLYGLYGGVGDSGNVWLQVGRQDGDSTLYDLKIQPLGGNTLFGGPIIAPSAKLQTYELKNASGVTIWTIQPSASGNGLTFVNASGVKTIKLEQSGRLLSKDNLVAHSTGID